MIYAYGICQPATVATPPARPGLGGARLRTLDRNGLAAVYSRHRTLRPRPVPEQVLAHERIVEAIMEHGPVLPMRFGTQLDAEERLADVLVARHDELLRALERVRDRVELGVRVIAERTVPATTASGAATDARGRRSSGRAYLLARVSDQRRRDLLARELHAPLAELAAGTVLREGPAPPAIVAGAYLVDAGRVEEFRARANALGERQRDVRVVVTGPWPPYSFTGEDARENRRR